MDLFGVQLPRTHSQRTYQFKWQTRWHVTLHNCYSSCDRFPDFYNNEEILLQRIYIHICLVLSCLVVLYCTIKVKFWEIPILVHTMGLAPSHISYSIKKIYSVRNIYKGNKTFKIFIRLQIFVKGTNCDRSTYIKNIYKG